MKKIVKKKWLAGVLVGVMLLSVLSGCGRETSKEEATTAGGEPEKVVLNEVAHSLFYAPLYVAIEKGYFTDAGIDLELVTGFGADKTMTALLAGDADIGFMGPETTVYTSNEGAEDLIVNFAQLTQRAGNFLVARAADESFSWQKLKGTTVLGGRDGGMPEMVFEYILKKNGIDPKKDLTIDKSIDFGSTAAAFSGGSGDYSVEFEPGATALENEGAGYVVASLGVDSGYVPYTAFSAKDSYMKEHPQVIRGFVEALTRGMEDVYAQSAEEIAAVIAPQFPDTDEQTMAAIIRRYAEQDTWKKDLKFEKDAYELLLDILDEAGQLSERVAYETLVTTEYVK